MGIPMLKIKRSGIPILVRRHLYIETAPWSSSMNSPATLMNSTLLGHSYKVLLYLQLVSLSDWLQSYFHKPLIHIKDQTNQTPVTWQNTVFQLGVWYEKLMMTSSNGNIVNNNLWMIKAAGVRKQVPITVSYQTCNSRKLYQPKGHHDE